MAEFAFRDRPPTDREMNDLILGLSTFRDGSGQVVRGDQTYPGWRDFERCTAAALDGTCPENKGIFDVLIDVEPQRLPYGISCKTSAIRRDGILMELHNSSAKAHGMLELEGINWLERPTDAGIALVDQVMTWHDDVRSEVDIPSSAYVVLTHDRNWEYFEIFWYGLDLNVPHPADMSWTHAGRRIEAALDGHRYWEWYGASGGQLKYYPPFSEAIWRSGEFRLLEPPYAETPLDKALRYWPDGS